MIGWMVRATQIKSGYATLVEKDAVRLATANDPGYYGTREEFESEKDQENRRIENTGS
ncbi:hypothetical protein IANJMKHF_00185 [Klebsiella phage CPRSA]|nr:hypothetical protein IANJMKHF_00185 [Klebsiella phage CPRSA]